MKTKAYPAALAIIVACLGTTRTNAQTEAPFLGTWKIDTSDVKQELAKSGAPEPIIGQRIAILGQQRWIFGSDGTSATITNGLPNKRSWKLLQSGGDTYEIEFESKVSE